MFMEHTTPDLTYRYHCDYRAILSSAIYMQYIYMKRLVSEIFPKLLVTWRAELRGDGGLI